MKKLILILLSIVLAAGLALLCACGGTPSSGTPSGGSGNNSDVTPDGDGKPKDELLDFTGITFKDDETVYDGEEHSITIEGTVPEGAKVDYSNNTGTNAGDYNASVSISKDGYNTLTLYATLKIKKANFEGLTLPSRTFVATGGVHSLAVEGVLPEGTSVEYDNNNQKAVGEYPVTATVTNPNYNDLVLTAKLKIISVTDVALDIISTLLDKPDPWSFLPEALSQKAMAYAAAPVTDFTSFVNVSAIGDKIIGKQLHVLYEGLSDTATALGYVDTVYAVVDTIASVYQNFINSNPENYTAFSGEAAGFKLKIALEGDTSEILIGNSVVSIELTYDKANEMRCGRVQITDGIALKYESSKDSLKLAVKTTVAGVGNIKQIEFLRDRGAVAGYLREYTGTSSISIMKTSAAIAIDSQYAYIISDKRESDDMKILGYEEVYDCATGKYIGGEVQETITGINYDTLWFMLKDVKGFNSVKALPQKNGANADTIFINGGESAFVAKTVGGFSLKMASRRFDVEMKEVWYVIAVQDGDKVKYDTVKCTIPMLCVQLEQTSTFGTDVKQSNANEFATAPELPEYSVVTSMYASMQDLFDTVKQSVTYEEIDNFIESKNEFFNN